MARPRGPPRRGARRMARTSVLPLAKPWRRNALHSRRRLCRLTDAAYPLRVLPPSISIKRGPRRASALWGGPAGVHAGGDGGVSQMFVPQKNDPFLLGRIQKIHTVLHYMPFFHFLQAAFPGFSKKSGVFCNFQRKEKVPPSPGRCFRQFFKAEEVIPPQKTAVRMPADLAVLPLTMRAVRSYNRRCCGGSGASTARSAASTVVRWDHLRRHHCHVSHQDVQ